MNMIKENWQKNKGFVLLFAVTLASILLAIALGVSNISLKEINFSTSARNSSDAIFAADTIAECALYYDRGDINRFASPDPGGAISCGATTVTPTFSGDTSLWAYDFNITGLGSNDACAKLNISKNGDSPYTTVITSRGYNVGDSDCASTDPNRTERELELTYSGNPPGSGSPPPPPPPPPPGFPVVQSLTETTTGALTAHNIAMPATVDANDLLLVLISNFGTDGNPTIITPSGWTRIGWTGSSGSAEGYVFAKDAVGNEDGTTVNFSTSPFSQTVAAHVYRITDWRDSGTLTSDVEVSFATGSSLTPNPPSLNPINWDVENTLWLALAVAGQANNDGFINGYPSSYTSTDEAHSGVGFAHVGVGSGRRELAAASENPGTFSLTGSEGWVAATVAVRPTSSPPPPPPPPTNYDLTVSKSGTGSGTVTSSPAGINCGADCSESYSDGTVVTLTPSAAVGSTFAGWSGDADCSDGSVTMSAARNCTATFNLSPPLTFVRANGTGGSTSTTLDIGSSGSNRLVVVIAGREGTTNLTGATVDGKSCGIAPAVAATNTNGVGNRTEMWYCDEDNLGSSSGTVTVAIQGGSTAWAVHALLFTGASQSGPTDTSTDTASISPTITTTMPGMDVPAGGGIVIGVGNGTQGLTVNSWTAPVATRFSAADPTSADLVSASGIEASAQTNKTYQATWSAAPNRSSGVAASWAPAL